MSIKDPDISSLKVLAQGIVLAIIYLLWAAFLIVTTYGSLLLFGVIK